MFTGSIHPAKADKLSVWLSERLGVASVLATPPATVWRNDDMSGDLADRIAHLDRSLERDEISFDTALRYRLAPFPEELKRLRAHEGLGPGAPAVLCPRNAEHLRALMAQTTAAGLEVAMADRGVDDTATLPVSFAHMSDVQLASSADGIIEFQAGASWDDLQAFFDRNDLWFDDRWPLLFATPACAVAGGLFKCGQADTVNGITHTFRVVTTPVNIRSTSKTWQFDGQVSAEKAFQEVCRHFPDVNCELFPTADYLLGTPEAMLLGRLGSQQRVYMTLSFAGTRLQRLATEVSLGICLERNGGRKKARVLNGLTTDGSDKLLSRGLVGISLTGPTNWEQLVTRRRNVHGAMIRAAEMWSSLPKHQPLLVDRLSYLNGQLYHTARLITLRDFDNSVAQWKSVFNAGREAAGQKSGQVSPIATNNVEESNEWRAIRDALLDENGRLRPLASDEPSMTEVADIRTSNA